MSQDERGQGQQSPTDSGGQSGGRGKRLGIMAVLLVAITGLLVGGGLVLINRSSDDVASYVVLDELVETPQPVFEPRDARGDDPFFPLEVQLASFQEDSMEEAMAEAESAGGDPTEIDPADFTVERLAEETKTGLYGGTAENTCDPERLISFLIDNPELGQAWAQIQDISFGEIPTYIRSLEVRVTSGP